MMNMKLIALASAGLFLVMAPMSHLKAVDQDNANPQAAQQQVGQPAVAPQAPDQVAANAIKNDDQVAKEIKSEINSDQEFASVANNIDIKSENGKVTLSGTVGDATIKSDIEVIAKDVAGDNNVIDNIVVKAAVNQ